MSYTTEIRSPDSYRGTELHREPFVKLYVTFGQLCGTAKKNYTTEIRSPDSCRGNELHREFFAQLCVSFALLSDTTKKLARSVAELAKK